MALHSFDPEIAERVGLNAAVVYQNLLFWCEHNAANDRHFHDGLYWTYNSMKAFGELFPYLTSKQVRTAIDKLVDAGLIKSGNYNKSAYDRTKWYAVIHLPKRANVFAPEGEPIPDSKPDGKRSTCNTPLLPSVDEPEKTMNERARTGEDRGGTQGDDGGWLDYLIEKLRSEFPDKGPYKNDAYRRKEASIIAQAVEGMSPEEADGWCQRVVSAFRAKDFGKWLEASGGKGWHPSLGNVIESGDWERFSGESLWL